MQLVIIAGGFGTRLRPLTLHRPKALVPLVDRPQIVYMLDSLPAMCDEVIIAVNYGFEAMREFFRTHEFGIEVRVVEEAKPLGTAGAIKNIQRHVRGTFAVYNGDVVDTIELDRFVEAHRQRRGIGTIAVWPVDDPSAFGVVGIEDGRITRFVEKPRPGEAPSNLVNAGRYVFEPMVFDFIEEGRAVSLERDVFPRLVERGLTAYRYDGYWSDAGTLPSYLNAQRVLLDAGRGKIAPEADVTAGSLRPPVYVGAGSYVEGRLGPHVVLGKSCKIGRASLSNAALWEGVSVDDKAEISSSILGAGASIGEGAHVRDSIVGDGVQVPAYATIFDDRVSA
ncbi:MAG: NDP-sugar synthase [Methanobacteriota archaeon]|nr:MAG: NDP-sugar synthase [Euryarchaeota archaeon]